MSPATKKAAPAKAPAARKTAKKAAPAKAAARKVSAETKVSANGSSSTSAVSETSGHAGVGATVVELRRVRPVDLVDNPLNPRRDLVGSSKSEREKFDKLRSSVREVGVLEPPVCFERDRQDGTLGRELVKISGHRRTLAAKLENVEFIDVIVRPEPAESDQLVMMLIENGHRNDLAPVEEARAYKQLLEQGVPQQDIALRVARSEGHVSKRLSLLDLPADVLGRLDVDEGEERHMTLEVAYALARVADDPALVTKLTKQASLNDRWILGDVERELERRAVAKAQAAAKAKLEEQGVAFVDPEKILSGVGCVLVGNAKPAWGPGATSWNVKWLGLTVAEHKVAACHAATITAAGKTVWVCAKPSAHKGVKTKSFRGYYGEPEYPKTVEDVTGPAEPDAAGTSSSSSSGSSTSSSAARRVDPAIAEGYEAARVRAVTRIERLHDFLTEASDAVLVDVVAVGAAATFVSSYASPNEAVAARLLGFGDFEGAARAKSFTAAFAQTRLRFAAAVAISTLDEHIFVGQLDDPFKSDYQLSSWYRADQWMRTLDHDVAKAYVDWLQATGQRLVGPVEKAWLALCKEAA